jgi:type II secretory pathway predicted ATPase ExeA
MYGIKEKKGFVVVTGEVGTGKTTLLRKALRSLDATYHSVFIFNTLLTFDELLETILRDLDLDPAGAGRVAMLERLNDFLLEKVKIGHIVSVLIDEAQNLSEDALEGVRLLSNMETDREKLLQIILVGQPELDVKLHSRSLRQLKQRVALWCRLDSLSLSDTEAYIRHRLQVAQYQGPDIFPASTIRSIWEYTSGIPRLINAVCDNALLTAYATSTKIVSVDIVREVVSDLRLQPENQRLGSVAAEHRHLIQPARASAGGEWIPATLARGAAGAPKIKNLYDWRAALLHRWPPISCRNGKYKSRKATRLPRCSHENPIARRRGQW